MKQEWKKTRVIYYSDPLNDDFDKTKLKRPPVPKNYKYKRTNRINWFFQGLLFYGLAKPILSIVSFFGGVKVGNRSALKELRKSKSGVFLYGNHVSNFDAFKLQSMIIHRRVNIIGFTDSLAINPIISYLVRAFGYLPLPDNDDLRHMKELQEATKFYIDKRQHIIIYPEAHVWPYYTKIRDFKSGSFHYPAKYNAPIMPFVTVWRKVWYSKKPKQTVIFGKMIYPKPEFDVHQNRDYLRDECYKEMVRISSSYPQVEYVKYIYKEKKPDGNE